MITNSPAPTRCELTASPTNPVAPVTSMAILLSLPSRLARTVSRRKYNPHAVAKAQHPQEWLCAAGRAGGQIVRGRLSCALQRRHSRNARLVSSNTARRRIGAFMPSPTHAPTADRTSSSSIAQGSRSAMSIPSRKRSLAFAEERSSRSKAWAGFISPAIRATPMRSAGCACEKLARRSRWP